jgi:hypothetical protein
MNISRRLSNAADHTLKALQPGTTTTFASVLSVIHSGVSGGKYSSSKKAPSVTRKKPRSVTTKSTSWAAVRGRAQRRLSFDWPDFSKCAEAAMTFNKRKARM